MDGQWSSFWEAAMGSSKETAADGERRLLWIVPTILCVVVASAVYSSRQTLQAMDDKERKAKQERAKSREARANDPFANSSSTTTKKKTTEMPEDDVWGERRRRGINASSSSNKKRNDNPDKIDKNDSKPFHSSYYYAHNNSKGGYSDGLAMEDYTMNGPRLLSRGGKPVQSEPQGKDNGTEQTTANVEEKVRSATVTETNDANVESRRSAPMIVPITKYLWDDPGDSTGLANIRVDSLPSDRNPSQMIPWKDLTIIDAQAQLISDSKGLLVVVRTTSNSSSEEPENQGARREVEYRLEIKQFYGSVTRVQALTTKMKKRLIIQVQKATSIWDRSNTNAWPHPHKKI